MSQEMWNERFSGAGYAYGDQPNDFLTRFAERIPAGPVLCLAEGEGRNAVFLASRGLAVTAVDWSSAGLNKARELARRHGVAITTVLADLASFPLGEACWSGIVSIFAHVSPALRKQIHDSCVKALAPGGVLILEAYAKDQIHYSTGGPRDPELLLSLAEIQEELSGLEPLHATEIVRHVLEGKFHTGEAAVVQFAGRKPLISERFQPLFITP